MNVHRVTPPDVLLLLLTTRFAGSDINHCMEYTDCPPSAHKFGTIAGNPRLATSLSGGVQPNEPDLSGAFYLLQT